MAKVSPLTFTLEGQPIFDPPPPDAPPPATPMPVFGPEYGGTIAFRIPTLGDSNRIEGLFTAYWQRQGVMDTGGLNMNRHLVVRSLMFFEVLKAADMPDWFSEDVEDGSEALTAIVRAYGVATQLMADRKKKSASTTGTSSAPS